MSKQVLFDIPVFGLLYDLFGCIPVRRFHADLRALRRSQEALQRGLVLGMFPEGTRSGESGLGRGEPGTALLAMGTDTPVRPVAIRGRIRRRAAAGAGDERWSEVGMEILLARDMGFCWGVRRAIDIMEKAAAEKGEITSLGPIVHNPDVVRDLEGKGVCVSTEPLDGAGGPVAITAHGAGPQVLAEARALSSEVVDTTCPIVTRSQRWAKKMADAGFTVVVFGDPEHREVKGVLAWAGSNARALGQGAGIR